MVLKVIEVVLGFLVVGELHIILSCSSHYIINNVVDLVLRAILVTIKVLNLLSQRFHIASHIDYYIVSFEMFIIHFLL